MAGERTEEAVSRFPPRFRNIPKEAKIDIDRLTAHKAAILRIQAQGIEQGLIWHRSGFARGICRTALRNVSLSEWNAGAKGCPDSLEDIAPRIVEDIDACGRVVPDLWRLQNIEGCHPIIHAVEVVDTSNLTAAKRRAYADLDLTLEEWRMDLRVWTTDRHGSEWREFDLEAAFGDVVDLMYSRVASQHVPD